jgi:hypothetical protein
MKHFGEAGTFACFCTVPLQKWQLPCKILTVSQIFSKQICKGETFMFARSFSIMAKTLVCGTFGVSIASAQIIDINGGNSWAGWNSVGNSQTSGIWVLGNTNRTFDIYSSSFVLGSSQSVGGTRLPDGITGNGTSYSGDTSASLFSDSWQAGDRIMGIGIRYTGNTRGNTFFFHTDKGGNNILPASSFGAGDGTLSFDAGDTSSYVLTNYTDSSRARVRQYSIFNGFSSNGGTNFTSPYGQSPTGLMPVRSFAVLDSGSTSVKSIQFLINADAVLRSNGGLNFGEGDLTASTTRFGFYEGDSNGQTEQIFPVAAVPEPASMIVLGAGALALVRRRKNA